MERSYAEYILKKTKENYNLIADDFSRTRSFISQDLKDLSEYTLAGERVLDLGCGNGRFFEVLKDKKVDYIGVDFSKKLIKIAKKKYPEAKFQVANALNLPFPNNFFDKIYSISVLQHIPSEEFRLQFLRETKRILRPEGLLILRVWDLWRRKKGQKLILRYTLLKIIGKSKLDFKDIFLPWKNSRGKILIQRYLHCFTKRELEKLIKKTGLKIKESWHWGKDPVSSIYLVAEK